MSLRVEHDPALGDAVAGQAVSAAPDGELRSGLARERDDARDRGGVGGPDDDRRPTVDAAVEDDASFVVCVVAAA